MGHLDLSRRAVERDIAVHFAIDIEPGCLCLDERQGVAHLDRAGFVAAAKVGVAEQGGFGLETKAQHFLGGHDGDLGDLFGTGVVIDMGVDQKNLASGQQQAVHARIGVDLGCIGASSTLALANHLVYVMQMQSCGAPGSANQAVDIAFVQQHGADQRQAPTHLDLGDLHGDALALGHLEVGLPKIAVAVVLLHIDHGVILPFAQPQTELLDPLADDGRAADQRGQSQPFVHHDLRGAQHPLVFALGESHALFERRLGHGKNRLHGRAGGVDKALQPLAVSVHIANRAQRDATVYGSLRHGGGNHHHQARVEGFGYQVLGAELKLLARIGRRHHFVLLGLRQFGNRVDRRNFHLDRDGRRTRVERAPEDIGEAQDVVDLVVVIGAASGDDRVITHRFDFFGQDFRRRIGQRKNQGLGRHRGHHVGLEHPTGREAQKDVRAHHHLAQGARAGLLGKDNLVLVHQLGAALVDNPGQISHKNVFAGNPQLHQKPQTGQGRRARTRGHQLDFFRVFADHTQAVENSRADHDGRAVLVIMEDRDLHALAQFALYIKTVGRFDVFQVDAAECGLE